jgi:CDP-diacylglycerol--glycerol-3-phosphate 3-phosphatidyltransferase
MNTAALNLPNWVSLSRLIFVPILWVTISHDRQWYALIAFGLACATDWLDGYLARKLDMITDLGKALDPLIDKLLILAPLMAMVEMGRLPAWGVYAIVGRELVVTAWRGSSHGSANNWGKLKTVCQMATVALLILHWEYANYFFWGTITITIWSGITYFLPAPEQDRSVP